MTGVDIALLAISAASAGAGIAQQRSAAKKSSKASAAISAENDRIQRARERQARLENDRRRRKARRAAIIARGDVTQDIVNRGIGLGGSSLASAQGSLVSDLATQLSDISQNQELGTEVFQANQQIGRLRDVQNTAGADSRFGQQVASLGGAIIQNFGAFSRIGNLAAGSLGAGSTVLNNQFGRTSGRIV